MTTVHDAVSLVDWHFRRATRPPSHGEADCESDGDTERPAEEAVVQV
jgi:hypothetical protein